MKAGRLPVFLLSRSRTDRGRALYWHEKRMERSVDGQFMGMGPRTP